METLVKPIIQGYTTNIEILRIGCNDISNKTCQQMILRRVLLILGDTFRSIMLTMSECSESKVNE